VFLQIQEDNMKEKILRFMTSVQGRLGRILMGIAILTLGMFVVQGTPGKIMSVVAFIPIAGGLFDFCLVAAAMGYPLSGSRVRQQLASK
jgi:hypothetical protein